MEFEYDMEHTTIGEFVTRIYRLLRNHRVVLRSGVLVVDYLLALPQEIFAQISSYPLCIIAQDIEIMQGPCSSLKQFSVLKCIGSGGFSKVYLTETYGEYLALKIIDKEQILGTQKQSIILNEKAILMKLRQHPFVTKLHYTIET